MNEQEPRQHYVDDEAGICWRAGCDRAANRLLTTRAKPDDTFPQGLLIEAAYCWDDAIWFAGANVAMYGSTFVSLVEWHFQADSVSDRLHAAG